MDDAGFVRRLERIDDLLCDGDGVGEGDSSRL
jgi:hypothetical protein